jgi:alginate O-acetyltransferase complex protein AlgI
VGISFFTFTQIAFLVDAYRGLVREYNFVHYCMFVTYFPHLIAGPILHHKEMMPQFAKRETYTINYDHLAAGISLFVFGLAKKLLLADNLSIYATPVFDAAAQGETITFLEAWGGALSYSLQIYFDFSGYTDMAIGLSRMFGVNLPINFYSPYKARSIIEFWRCWHMTLSRFLRDYLYIPLGGNQKGKTRRYINLLVTMLLGGLWHGANWTFLAWGGLHGTYLIINHAWKGLREKLGYRNITSPVYSVACRLTTFLAVVIAWVFFRADSFSAASEIIAGMFFYNGLSIPFRWINEQSSLIKWLLNNGVKPINNITLFAGDTELIMIGVALMICWFLPNSVDIFAEPRQGKHRYWCWQPTGTWVAITVVLGVFSFLSISELSEFIYFQF